MELGKLKSMAQTSLTELYGTSFYDSLEQSTFKSAEVIVPLVMQLLSPRSAVDVGCGRGIWLSVLERHGVSKLRGIDGQYAAADKLFIARDNFTAADLTKPFSIGDRFDLAICLEVVEHLPDTFASGLVRKLTEVAPCVLFSAAIPGQGGQYHIHERWPEHWHEHFRSNGFVPFDYFRPLLYSDRRVCWWYRQNLVLYVSTDFLRQRVKLTEVLAGSRNCDLDWVHGDIYRDKVDLALRTVLRMLPPIVWRALRNRLRIVRRKFCL